jgi:hypothetical protein
MVKKLEHSNFNIWWDDKTNKVIGHEREDDTFRDKLITLESYSFVSLEQLKATIKRLGLH